MKTMTPVRVFVAVAALLAGGAPASHACSTFCFEAEGGLVFGKNYDWDVDDGMLVVNKRGVAKVGLPDDNPARWTSRYGSVTFNQYGRELPSGGMNEAGLVVELMWMDETEYPAPDDRSSVTTLQWIQYQLDNCATVGEVIASDARIRISSTVAAPIHFLVADRAGASAAVEFIGGKLVAHAGEELPYRALTNSTYERSAEAMRRYAGYGGAEPLPRSRGSLERFARAADFAARYTPGARSAVDYAFGVLDDVAQGARTQWSIVYDAGALRVHFKTHRNPRVRWIDLGALDFDCSSPVAVVDMNAAHAGDLRARLRPYTHGANLDLIVRAFGQTDFLRGVPRDTLESLARYPERTRCDS